MDLSVSVKDEIWFLSVCHHVSNALYYIFVVSYMSCLHLFGFVSYRLCFGLSYIIVISIGTTLPLETWVDVMVINIQILGRVYITWKLHWLLLHVLTNSTAWSFVLKHVDVSSWTIFPSGSVVQAGSFRKSTATFNGTHIEISHWRILCIVDRIFMSST